MTHAFSAFKAAGGGGSPPLYEREIIAFLGVLYTNPDRSHLAQQWQEAYADAAVDHNALEDWQVRIIQPAISRISGQPSRSLQRHALIQEFVRNQECITHHNFALKLDGEYQAYFLAFYPDVERMSLGLARKVAQIRRELAASLILQDCLMLVARRGFSMITSNVRSQMLFLEELLIEIQAFELEMSTLHISAPDQTDIKASSIMRRRAGPTLARMNTELSAAKRVIAECRLPPSATKHRRDRVRALRSDFVLNVFRADMG